MTEKFYTIEQLKELLINFHNSHPNRGEVDEWYADVAHMVTIGAKEFLSFVKHSEHGHNAITEKDIENNVILEIKP